MTKLINPDQFAEEVTRQLGILPLEAQRAVDHVSLKVAKEAVEKLKKTSPKRTGAYANSWATRSVRENRLSGLVRIVHNAQHYRLTHLLEFGFINAKTGRRTRPRPHIAPVEDWMQSEFPNLAETELRKSIKN